MVRCCVLLALLGLASAALLPGERDLTSYTYEDYEREFNKGGLLGEERERRHQIFQENLAVIRVANAIAEKSWYADVNEFTAWTNEEFRAQKVSVMPQTNLFGANAEAAPSNARLEDLPASVDWRALGVVSPPKNQGGCGSCWAFSATETLESRFAMAFNVSAPVLSPQQVTSCTPNPNQCGGSGGCGGATQPLAFAYTEGAGLTSEESYPYQGVDSTGTCETARIKPLVRNSGYVVLKRNDYTALITAVATGPVSISVAAGGWGWSFYSGGVFAGSACGFTMDHAVQLVGYGVDGSKMYWLVRNSWGASWGESGYIRILRNGEGKEPCGVDNDPADGDACKGDTSKPTLCGVCAILSSSSYPTGMSKADESFVV